MLQKPEISAGSNKPLGSEYDLGFLFLYLQETTADIKQYIKWRTKRKWTSRHNLPIQKKKNEGGRKVHRGGVWIVLEGKENQDTADSWNKIVALKTKNK